MAEHYDRLVQRLNNEMPEHTARALVDLAISEALRAAAEQWRPYLRVYDRCPTCEGRSRETSGLVCFTCGRDYGDRDSDHYHPGACDPGGACGGGDDGER